jgi:hypothetical protein
VEQRDHPSPGDRVWWRKEGEKRARRSSFSLITLSTLDKMKVSETEIQAVCKELYGIIPLTRHSPDELPNIWIEGEMQLANNN